ncbi:MAG: PHP domain-containing protein [Dehalococcoidia bacterium]|nr:PHP domain-containing protein [Dehalococcoidia bacterium]
MTAGRRSTADFHTHSDRSDGTYAPANLVRLAHRNGVRTLAISDHDTFGSLAEAREAASRLPGMRIVPAVEIGCDAQGDEEIHVLGLFVDPTYQPLVDELERMRAARIGRAQEIVRRLEALGTAVSWQRVLEYAGGDEGSVGRPHIARALVGTGVVESVQEAFDTLLADGGPAFVEREKIDPALALRLIHNAGGLAVYAHPAGRDPERPVAPEVYTAITDELMAAGLDGIEVYYRAYDRAQVETLRAFAEEGGLLPTGGSDFHGLSRDHETEPGCFHMPPEAVQRALDTAAARGCLVPAATPVAN